MWRKRPVAEHAVGLDIADVERRGGLRHAPPARSNGVCQCMLVSLPVLCRSGAAVLCRARSIQQPPPVGFMPQPRP
jgi:hypothetical protein